MFDFQHGTQAKFMITSTSIWYMKKTHNTHNTVFWNICSCSPQICKCCHLSAACSPGNKCHWTLIEALSSHSTDLQAHWHIHVVPPLQMAKHTLLRHTWWNIWWDYIFENIPGPQLDQMLAPGDYRIFWVLRSSLLRLGYSYVWVPFNKNKKVK